MQKGPHKTLKNWKTSRDVWEVEMRFDIKPKTNLMICSILSGILISSMIWLLDHTIDVLRYFNELESLTNIEVVRWILSVLMLLSIFVGLFIGLLYFMGEALKEYDKIK